LLVNYLNTDSPSYYSFIQEDSLVSADYASILESMFTETDSSFEVNFVQVEPQRKLQVEPVVAPVVPEVTPQAKANAEMTPMMIRNIIIFLVIGLVIVLYYVIMAMVDMQFTNNSLLNAKYGSSKTAYNQ